MRKIVFDIETKETFADIQSDDFTNFNISVLSLWDSETDKYYSFQEEQFDEMWSFFKKADLIITFNGEHFDLPILQKYTDFDLGSIRHIDILKEIQKSIGKKIGLDAVASATLGTTKSANGLQAVAWWNSGEIDKIIKYCEQDVKVTKDVYEYALNNQKLYFIDRKTGQKTEINLDTSSWEGSENTGEPLTLF